MESGTDGGAGAFPGDRAEDPEGDPMERAATPEAGTRIALSASHSHLFRGARLVRADRLPGAGDSDGAAVADDAETHEDPFPAGAAALRIRFSDGVETDAELLQRGTEEFAIDVPGYRTAAGSDIAPKAWRIARIETEPRPGATVLVVGERLA